MALSQSQRFRILRRDLFRCRYCGQRSPNVVLEVDHIVPRAAGGKDHDSNLVAACFSCNRGKSAKGVWYVPPPAKFEFTEAQKRTLAELEAAQEVTFDNWMEELDYEECADCAEPMVEAEEDDDEPDYEDLLFEEMLEEEDRKQREREDEEYAEAYRTDDETLGGNW